MKYSDLLIATLMFLAPHLLLAQMPYTIKQYSVYTQKDIVYGTATGFAGNNIELVLDLYKPVGDNNCQRPLLVMAHGGGFVAGSRNDADVVQICQEMAARGYVAASIEYRLGLQTLPFYEPYAFCNDAINPIGINKCIYMADTMEFYRGAHRAVQDMRGAIRFLKGRHEMDSTDIGNVFIGGSSAGAITALHTAFLDEDEQLQHTSSVPDAPVPDADLTSCIPGPADRSRPDLGDLDGNLNQNGYDSKVQGVADFMGALFDIDYLQGNLPAIYAYHRTDDLVVPHNHSILFGLYTFCLNPINLCQPLYTRPWVVGSSTVMEEVSQMGGTAPPYFNDILDLGPADGDDCLDDPPGHSISNIPLRCENLSGFFAPIIAANGNSPTGNCTSSVGGNNWTPALEVYPNPAINGTINIVCKNCPSSEARLTVFDNLGRAIASTKSEFPSFSWQLRNSHMGIHFLKIEMQGATIVRKIVF